MRARHAALALLLALGCEASDDGETREIALCEGAGGCAGAPGSAGSAGAQADADLLWSKHFEGVADRYVVGAAPAPGGDVVLVGFFVGTIDLGGGALSSGEKWSSLDPPWSAFVARLSSDGGHRWSKRFGGSGSVRPQGVAVDAKGNVAVVGGFSGSFSLGDDSLQSEGGSSAFVAMLSPDGQPSWAKAYGSAGDQSASAAAFAGDGDLLFTGALGGKADLGGGPLESQGDQDLFVARLDSKGAHVWSKRFGGPGSQRAMALAVDGDDLVLAGSFSQKLDLGRGPMVSAGGSDLFVARLDGGGDVIWNIHAGDKADQIARSAAFSGGLVTVVGEFAGTIDLGEAAPVVAGSCGKGTLFEATGRCYELSTEKKTFEEARELCKKQGGDLASIGSPGELAFVKKTFTFESAWVGATDATAEGQWSWVDGEPFVFAPWNEGEPNGKEAENCAELTASRMNDLPCGEARLSLCERSPGASGAGGKGGAGGSGGSGGASGEGGASGASGQAGEAGAGGQGAAGAASKTALKSKGGVDGFVIRLDGAGRKRWDRALGDGDEQRLWAVIHDGERAVIAGDAPGDFALGGALDAGHVLLASLDGEGEPRWATRLGPGVGQGLALAPGPQRIYAGGVFSGKLATRVGELSSPGRVGAFLLARRP